MQTITEVLEVVERGDDGYLVKVRLDDGTELWVECTYSDPCQLAGVELDDVI